MRRKLEIFFLRSGASDREQLWAPKFSVESLRSMNVPKAFLEQNWRNQNFIPQAIFWTIQVKGVLFLGEDGTNRDS